MDTPDSAKVVMPSTSGVRSETSILYWRDRTIGRFVSQAVKENVLTEEVVTVRNGELRPHGVKLSLSSSTPFVRPSSLMAPIASHGPDGASEGSAGWAVPSGATQAPPLLPTSARSAARMMLTMMISLSIAGRGHAKTPGPGGHGGGSGKGGLGGVDREPVRSRVAGHVRVVVRHPMRRHRSLDTAEHRATRDRADKTVVQEMLDMQGQVGGGDAGRCEGLDVHGGPVDTEPVVGSACAPYQNPRQPVIQIGRRLVRGAHVLDVVFQPGDQHRLNVDHSVPAALPSTLKRGVRAVPHSTYGAAESSLMTLAWARGFFPLRTPVSTRNEET